MIYELNSLKLYTDNYYVNEIITVFFQCKRIIIVCVNINNF